MSNTSNLSIVSEYNKVFYANGTTWQTWTKPTNCKMVYFYVLGGGSGGGGAKSSSSNTSPGGGGGASSAITVALYSAHMLPDTLYIQIGLGGIGGLGGTAGGLGNAGSPGSFSYVCLQQNLTALNILLKSGDAVPTAGTGAFSTTGTGAAGTGGTAWTYSTSIISNMGIISTTVGSNGTGGTGSGGSPNNLTPTLPVTGGTGGGYGGASDLSTFKGGSILGTGFLTTLPSGTINLSTSAVNGNDGYTFINTSNIQNPMFFTGGTGGAGTYTSGINGGNGGSGSYGCGGGGGAGASNANGGNGGKGGDGIVIISCY